MESLEIGHHLLYTKAFTFAIYMIQSTDLGRDHHFAILGGQVTCLFFFFTKNIEFLR